MEELFAQARAQNLWFFSPYQSMWFHPDELEREQARGRFLWGPVNWRLRDPQERLTELIEMAQRANAAVFDFRAKLTSTGAL